MADIKEISIGDNLYIIRDANALHTSGGTVTGLLTVAGNGTRANLNMQNNLLTRAEALASTSTNYSGSVQFRWSDGYTGYVENRCSNNMSVTQIVATKDNSSYTTFGVGRDANNKVWFSHPQIITSYVSGLSGYNIWSNGYCEQWGQYGPIGSNVDFTVSLYKTYSSSNYNVQGTFFHASANYDEYGFVTWRSTTQFGVYQSNGGDSWYYLWKTSGYLASNQY